MTQIKTDKKRIRSAQISFFRVISVPFLRSFIWLSVILSSCSSGPFPGYKKVNDQVYLKLISFSDATRKVKVGDIVKYELVQLDEAGKIQHEGWAMNLVKVEMGTVEEALLGLSEGDSVSLVFGNQNTKEAVMYNQVKIIKVQTEEEYDAEQKRIAEVGDIDENKKLKEYLKENKINEETINNGLYMIAMQAGKGDSVKGGKTVQIAYKGYFLDGREFDATKPDEPLEFVYGTEMQVIDGLRMAVGRMRAGQKSKIIIPSHFAFGEKGSSTGVVPPFTTLIYEVEIVNVK